MSNEFIPSSFQEKMETKLNEYAESAPSNVCGGMHACKNRIFDRTKDDCQECLEDANKAIVNAGYDTWD